MSAAAIVVFGVGSDASVDQWDGYGATRGIMLRWFLPDLGFPQLGFDVYRAAIPDIPPLPFDDINTAAVSGAPSWEYAGIVTLSCASGLTFQPTGFPGRHALVITPNAPVHVRFNGTAWRIQVIAEPVGAGIEVVALVDGLETLRETLDQTNAQLLWRTRHVGEIVLRGEGTVSFIGFHLLDDSRFWTHIAHRCLPVHDAGYACAPRGAATEKEEAVMTLPAAVAADWKERFSEPFKAMLPALRRLARGDAPAPIPPDRLDPRHPTLATEGGSNERALIRIALLDPHVARILGLAYDDPVSLNGQEYAYKVTGLWRGARREVEGVGLQLDDFFKQLGKAGARVESVEGDGSATIDFPDAVIDFVLDIDGRSTLEWSAQDDLGNKSEDLLDRKRRTLALPRVATLRLQWTVGSDPVFTRASWHVIERRTGVLPSVYARDPGPPVGPASIDATVQLPESPSGIASAALDWPLPIGSDGATLEGEVIAYQVGRRFLGAPASSSAPATVPATGGDVQRPFAPLYLSQQSIAGAPPRKLHVDYNDGRGLGPGWWGWWVRGVDLFGRVSAASSWDVGKVEDVAPPPAPVLVQAEWVQRSLPPMTVSVVGRSVEASRWLAATATENPLPEAGLVVAWALPPEQAALRDDIDGFRLFLRKAAARPGAAADAPLEYEDWPPAALANAALAQFGPLQIVGRGMIVSVKPNPPLAVTLSAGEPVPQAPQSPTAPVNPPLARTAYRTDLTLDGASGVFVGGTLTIGGRALTVVSSGDGPDLIVVVEHPGNAAPPAAGAATLRAAASKLVNFETDVPDLPGVRGLSVRSGLLLDEKATPARFAVLRKRGDEFLCVNPPPPSPLPPGYVAVAPAAGHVIAWHPVWFASLSDTGFGPVAGPSKPVVNAQVAVQAVRLVRTLALPSARSATLTVTAVDVAPPPTPAITPIPYDPAGTCAELASRADWYGDSRFTLSWASQADCTFTVYRALADEVFRLDREHVRRPATRDLAQGRWPAGVWTDAARKARVQQELSAIDAALAAAAALADADARAALIDAVYDAACNDTQMFLGLQPHTWAAFTPLFGRPIETKSHTNTLNGRTRAHWFYAVTARSLAGVESLPSTISPPICCPDVVPPAPPLAHSALAAEGAVKLKWLASPDADTHHYEIYAAREPDAVANLDTLIPVPTYSGYELRLMSVNTADGLLDEGRNVVIVALVGADMHIRIFDTNGNRVINKAENELTSGETLTTVKEQLNPLPEESSLSQTQKQQIIRDATSIAGHTPYGVEQSAPRAATPATPHYAPMPHVSGQTIERFVPRARNEMGEWCFWIVATDTAGNRSGPSRLLRGRALQPPPLPPVWISAERTNGKIELSWTYPTETNVTAGADRYSEDPRWATLIERRPSGGGFWASVSQWLPRGEYSFADTPPSLESVWEYRLKVRDHLGQMATEQPEITVEAVP